MKEIRVAVRVFAFLAIALLFLAGTRVLAQATSSVTGVVTDPSGAVIEGVNVTLADSTTGFSTATTTNNAGIYQFQEVPPGGHYVLTFTKANFQTYAVQNVALAVGTKETKDAKLLIGDTKTTIEVKSEGEATLNTTDASIGTVVDGERVQDLPSLFVNNAAALLQLAPGVITGTQDSSQAGVVTGTRGDQSNIVLDGLDINDNRIGQAFVTVINTPLDSIQELRTTVGGGDASYGHSAGAQVELVTRSGTNNFHGQAYEFNRVTAFAANDFFNNLNGVPRPQLIRNQFGGDVGGPIVKDKLFFFFAYNGLRAKQSQEINDVVPLDALRNGQLNYINSSDPTCGPSSNIVSSPSCISTTPLTGPNSLAALDPQGIGTNQALLQFLSMRGYPKSNNNSVGDLINTAGFQFAGPVQNKDNTFLGKVDYQLSPSHRLFARGTWDRSNDSDSANHVVQVFPGDPAPLASIIDHSRSWVVGETWIISPTMTNVVSVGETNQTLVFPLTSKPNFPNLLDFFFNGDVVTAPFVDGAPSGAVPGSSSFNEQFPIVPVYQIRDTFTKNRGKHTLQFGGVIKPTIFKSGNLTDFNSYHIGLGGGLQSLTPGLRPSDINGDPVASNEWDLLFPLALGRISSFTSAFNFDKAGNPTAQGTIPVRDYHATEYEFFGQDTWNIRSDLTLTYGLRWEFHNPLTEVNGFEAIPNISEQQLFSAREANSAAGIEGSDAAPLVSYRLGGSANHAPGYYKPSYTNFAPRIGIAYSPSKTQGILGHLLGDRKSSLRAGFGINYDVNLIGQGFELDETSFLFSNSFGVQGNGLATDPRFGGFGSLPTPPSPGLSPRPTLTPNIDANGIPIGFNDGGFGPGNVVLFNFDPKYKTPYEMSFNLSWQRELPGNWLIDVGYFGKLGRRLTAVGDPAQTLNFKDAQSNQFLYTAFGNVQKQLQAGVQPGALPQQPWFEHQVGSAAAALGFTCPQLSNIFFGPGTNFDCTNLSAGLEQGPWTNGDVSSTLVGIANINAGDPAQGLLPLNAGQLAQNGAAGFIGNFSSSNYHALLLRVNHRLSHNLAFELDYALSHSIDNDSDIQNSLIGFSGAGLAEVCDLRDLRVCRSNSNFDARHVASVNFEYALPFGRGQWMGHDAGRLLDEAIGGWKVSSIITAHSGFPIKIDTGTFPIDFTQTAGAVFVGSQSDVKRGIHQETVDGQTSLQYFSSEPNAFGAFTFPFGGGTGDRNIIRGPRFVNTDFAILKDFKMPWKESHTLQFRAEAFNLFNHPNFNPPTTNILSPGNFGNLNSTVATTNGNDSARQLQLALVYRF
ncbi:MAG: carboxypeptidase regulatory-like domain-containing protein [Candidatus Acidiferrales bacterium]